MQVRLNCWRGDHGPGEVIDIDDADAAGLLAHGGAFPVEPAPAPAAGRIVKGAATLEAATGSGDGTP